MFRLLIVTTHPIQYNAPLFKYMAESGLFDLKVFYTWEKSHDRVYDKGFEITRKWDIELLDGYNYEFIKNTSANPSSDHYWGIINPSLINEVKDFNPDAILAYGWKFQSHLRLMRFFKGSVPILFRGDSTLLDQSIGFSIRKLFRKFLLKWVYSYVDIALSPGTSADAYFRFVGLNTSQIVRAPHAIDIERFADQVPSKKLFGSTANSWSNELGIPENNLVFLFAGKLEFKKNISLLINAFFELKKQKKNISLVIVGSGPLEHKLKKLVEVLFRPSLTSYSLSRSTSEQLFSDIFFIPFQNQSMMPMVYRLADVFVMPSRGPAETWGLAVNEAMASGKAVIVSDKCGCAVDLVKDEQNGFVFQSGNKEDLVSKMNMIADKSTALKMGEESRSIIAAYSFKNLSEAIKICLDKHEALR